MRCEQAREQGENSSPVASPISPLHAPATAHLPVHEGFVRPAVLAADERVARQNLLAAHPDLQCVAPKLREVMQDRQAQMNTMQQH